MDSFCKFCDRLLKTRERLKARADNKASLGDINLSAWKDNFPKTEAVRQLLELAYYLSLEQYEGRPTITTLRVEMLPFEPNYIAKFESANVATVKELRQLAQVANGNNSTIAMKLDDGVCAIGIVPMNIALESDSTYEYGICVAIRGPGHLEYFEGGYASRYTRGETGRLRQFAMHPNVNKSLESATCSIVKRALESLLVKERGDFTTYSSAVPTKLASTFLIAMLREIEAGGHGGAVLIVPDEHPLKEVRLGYTCEKRNDCDPLTFIAEKFMLNARFEQESKHHASMLEFDAPLNLLDQLRRTGRAYGKLANCDGAIVMTRNAKLLGFGGIIDPRGAASATNSKLKHKGARHNSAHWFCESVRDSIAIVVSSDGGVTLLYNEGGETMVTANLWI